ncbi:hypothetical protein Mlab_0536 [Methanocorpusculum labreanum Z]|uniref:DUF4332 domain-containing protein n=1 Tax=Methanocorpusculum labreanum (strain ATCC 43576 / DSM 4855 / Z) TaxID=410358 RepID=A2SQV4_METLZ|nr:DUF4332 domain-containing protein [Methanocorpusculum labreanum]ABN06710.1 hypothetical protein Mlab_0536 [Methanocorpusculum labreanum Z]
MSYSIDLTGISLQSYQEILKKQNLLPSRRILLDDLETNFQRIADAGIGNMSALKKAVSSPEKLAKFAAQTHISKEYLTILKRELGSLEQKPVQISDFPGLSGQTVQILAKHGIKTSKDVYTAFQNEAAEKSLMEISGISRNELEEVCCLSDLVRINGVGAAAARAMFEAGYKNISDIASADAVNLLGQLSAVNADGRYYHAKLGKKDMQFVIDFAVLLRDLEKK